MVKLQGNNLELTVFATGGGNTQRQRPPRLSLSLSLSRLLSSLSLSGKTENEQQHKTVCPKSYLYTYDFRAIYKYSLNEPLANIFTNMSPHPDLSPGTFIIRLRNRGSSASGSVAGVFIIRLRSRVLFIIRLRSRVLFIRLHAGYSSSGFMPGTLHPPVP